jgi:hypothetical protein
MTGTGDAANRHASRSSASSVRSGRWWNSATRRTPALGQLDRIVGRGIPERRLGRHCLGQRLGIVYQQVGPGGQFDGGRVVFTPSVWSLAQRRRAVIGDVGRHRTPVAHPVPDRPPPLCGISRALIVNPSALNWPGDTAPNVQLPRSWLGRIGK